VGNHNNESGQYYRADLRGGVKSFQVDTALTAVKPNQTATAETNPYPAGISEDHT
jgi:hypothetical protein